MPFPVKCLRCIRFGFVCDGYALRLSDQRTTRELVPRSDLRAGIPRRVLPNISSGGPSFCDELERQYFAVFESTAAPNLCGYFDSDIWTRLIPQLCHQEAYVREAA
jgi:hypothetical protein